MRRARAGEASTKQGDGACGILTPFLSGAGARYLKLVTRAPRSAHASVVRLENCGGVATVSHAARRFERRVISTHMPASNAAQVRFSKPGDSTALAAAPGVAETAQPALQS